MANQREYNKEKDTFWGGTYPPTGNDSSLKRKSLFFFVLTILLTLIVMAGVLYESTNHRMHILPSESSSDSLVHGSSGYGEADHNCLTGFPSILLTGSLILLLCTLIVGMIFFLRHFIIPLENIGHAVQRMTVGQLDKSIRIQTRDEIGQVGECINDLAINMQEILLYIWNHSQQNLMLFDSIAEQLNGDADNHLTPSQLKNDFAQMRQDAEDLQSFVTSFNYFEVKLEHEKMVSDPQQDNVESKS